MAAAAQPVEGQLLLQIARASIATTDGEGLRALLTESVDWSRLLSLADRHAMLPLVAHQLEAIGEAKAPPDAVRAELHSEFLRNAARSLMLSAELPRLLEALNDAGIPALPYKGPLLAVAAYGNPGLRRMRDLDLIVAPSTLDRARSVLAGRGYRQYTRLLRGPMRLRLEYQCGMIRDSDDAIVELHWRIAPPNMVRSPSFEELWARRVTTTFRGDAVSQMSNEDRLVALCIHGSKHAWKRLEWIASVAGVLANDSGCDWSIVRRRAAELHGERMVRLGLLLARDLLGSSFDRSVSEWLDDDLVAPALSAQVARELFVPDGSLANAESLTAFQWRVQDDAVGKLRFLTYWPLVRLARRAAASPRLGSTA